MIRRLYVDNFRSLVDFTWEPGEETLVLGYNGSGKTSVFDALEAIRSLISGTTSLSKPLNRKDWTRFKKTELMKFELTFTVGQETFEYKTNLFHHNEKGELNLLDESLSKDGQRLVSVSYGEVEYSEGIPDRMAKASLPTTQSGIAFLRANRQAPYADRLVRVLEAIINVRPVPSQVSRDAEDPENRPSRSFENFVAWYWNHSTNGAYQRAMLGLLENVWPEFDHLKMERYGREAWGLAAVFKRAERTTGELSLDFDELSDGERMLVMLYALVAYQKSQPATTIIVDEPDNFVSLLELQPWLRTLLDTRPEGGQVILVSHNPEIIQTMGEERVAWFSREDHLSPTRVSALPPDDSGLSLPERLARGWVDA